VTNITWTYGYEFDGRRWVRRWLLDRNETWVDLRDQLERPRLPPLQRWPPIQGTASDIVKRPLGITKIQAVMDELHTLGAIVLPLHDEIHVECPDAVKSQVASILEKYAIQCVQDHLKEIGPINLFPVEGLKWEDQK
jgi:hypothetical protein